MLPSCGSPGASGAIGREEIWQAASDG